METRGGGRGGDGRGPGGERREPWHSKLYLQPKCGRPPSTKYVLPGDSILNIDFEKPPNTKYVLGESSQMPQASQH